MIGIMYNGLHSYNDFGLYMRSEDRNMLPTLRKRQLVIPSKHGVYDFGDNTNDVRVISVKFTYTEADLNSLRLKARAVAAWLSGEGQLIFDDEPDKYYQAKVYTSVKISDTAYTAEFSVQFECQPMAQYVVSTGEDIILDSILPLNSDVLLKPVDNFKFNITSSPTEVIFENWGTSDINYKSQVGALSKIIITGSFVTFSITLNGKTLNYNEAVNNGTVTIDNVNCTVKLGGVNKLSVVTGDLASFLKLVPGTNTATITGTGLNCSVLFDFIPLYI